MKRIIMGLLSGILFLTACGGTSSSNQTAPIPAVEQVTLTPSPIPTNTITYTPTTTPTASITPLPTIPTFTPTFDVSTIVTVTPVRENQCPILDQTLELDLQFREVNACIKSARENNKDPFDCQNKDLYNVILNYLNSGGDINKILSQLNEEYKNYDKSNYFNYIELTGDSTPELLLRDTSGVYSGGIISTHVLKETMQSNTIRI